MQVPIATVLVVDDDALIRMHMIDILEDAGFETLEAPHADEALLLLQAHPEIRAVVTDIEMPGETDGLKLAAIIRIRWPPCVLVIVSGNAGVLASDLPSEAVFLPKPVSAITLAETLCELGLAGG